MLLNGKMPTIDVILTFVSMVTTTSEKSLIFQHFSFNEQLEFHDKLR